MLRVLMLLGLCVVAPAQAGLFADDDARKQIQQLEARVHMLEDAVKQQSEANKQQIKSMLDLQSQIDALNSEIRKLRGQNEETSHGLQDAEKRQKDFYVDLDTRVRHFESAELAAKEAAEKAAKEAVPASAVSSTATISSDPFDTGPENRAFEAAYGLYKHGDNASAVKAFQDFTKNFPASVHVPNANYWLGKSQFALKNYKSALAIYQALLADSPDTHKEADILLDAAACQQALKKTAAARKTLKQIISKYPSSEAAAKAKKLLSTKK